MMGLCESCREYAGTSGMGAKFKRYLEGYGPDEEQEEFVNENLAG
jgi:hypothetical protein